jgi:predicted nucleotidyltransferase
MTFGIGYQEYRKKRVMNENLRYGDIEKTGNERYIIYFGRAHVIDHLSNTEHTGPLKIGRGKFATALMRGRNQPGIDFRIYAEIVLESNEATYAVENLIKSKLGDRNMTLSQNQQECYNITNQELPQIVESILDDVKGTMKQYPILEVNIFLNTT